jgi:transposase
MAKRYRIELTRAEREELTAITRKKHVARRKMLHARILLKADEGPEGPKWIDEEISKALEVGVCTVERTRAAFVEDGMETAINGKPSSRRYRRKLDGDGEAQLVALSCGEPPEGHRRWTLKLLSEHLVELEVVDSISENTVRTTLKKMNLSLG